MTAKPKKTVDDLLREKAALEAKLAELEAEEKAREEEIKQEREEVMSKGLVRYFSAPARKEELLKIMDEVLATKGDRQLFGLAPRARKTPIKRKRTTPVPE